MASAEKFEKPGKKKYSVREMLTQERLQESIRNLLQLQNSLMHDLTDESYAAAERILDTAVASMIAHMTDVDVKEVFKKADEDAAGFADYPTLQSGA